MSVSACPLTVQSCVCVFLFQVVCADVGAPGRRLRRHVDLNRLQDLALCWWKLDEPGEEPWPWTPTDMHRNNLVLLSCSPTEGLKVNHTYSPDVSHWTCEVSFNGSLTYCTFKSKWTDAQKVKGLSISDRSMTLSVFIITSTVKAVQRRTYSETPELCR